MALDGSVLDSIYGIGGPGMGGGQGGPEYLSTNKRSAMSRLALNTGSFYLLGTGLGSFAGAVQGFRKTDSKITRIRLNGLANGMEGGVKTYGNAFGVLALTYSLIDAVSETAGVDTMLPRQYADDLSPVLSATATGFFYKITTSPKQAILAAGLGGVAMASLRLMQQYLPRDIMRSIKHGAF